MYNPAAWLQMWGQMFAFSSEIMIRGPIMAYATAMIRNPFLYYGGVIPALKKPEEKRTK